MILPNRGYLLIKVIKRGKRTKEGVYLPDSVANEEPMYGEVLAIGRPWLREGGVVEEAPQFDILDKDGNPEKRYKLHIGDTIIFKRMMQQELADQFASEEEEKIAFLSFDNVLGIELKKKGKKKK